LIDTLEVVPFSSLSWRALVVRPFNRTPRFFSEPCRAAVRDPRASPSTGCSVAVSEAAEADCFGSVPVGVAVIHLAGLAIGTDPGPTGDGHWLAPQGIPPLLEVEIPPWTLQSSQCGDRNTATDSTVVLAKPDLIDKLRVAVYSSIPVPAPTCRLSWLRFSLPSGAARRFSSRSSHPAIDSAFCSEDHHTLDRLPLELVPNRR
jgi:hypothetical protein